MQDPSLTPEGPPPALTRPIAPGVLDRLLRARGISRPRQDLSRICDTCQPPETVLRPAERLGTLLKHLDLRRMQVCFLRWDRLDRRSLPVLVFLHGQWQFLDQAPSGELKITGPEKEAAVVGETELKSAPALWFRPRPGKGREIPLFKGPALAFLWKEMKKDPLWFPEVLAATVVINLIALATSLFAMQVYDRVVPTFAYATLTTLTLGMGVLLVLDFALKSIRARITDTLARNLDLALSSRLFSHVADLRLDTRPGDLGTLAAQMNSLEQIRSFFSSTIIFFATDLPFCLFFIFMLFVVGGYIGFIYALIFPLALVLGWVAQYSLKQTAPAEIRRSHRRQGLLAETLQGAETIQTTGSQWRFSRKWDGLTAAISQSALGHKTLNAVTLTAIGSLGTIGYVGALVLGVVCVEAGDLTTGGMIACSILGGRVIQPVAQGIRFMVQWEQVKASLDMVNRILSMETRGGHTRDLLFPDHLSGRMDLEGLRFSYPGSPVVCLDIPELSVHEGERVVVLGPNGCGKSTLLKVMAGLYRPGEGRVRLGETDLKELDPQVVTRDIGYLPQNIHLFRGTLKSNMGLNGGIPDTDLIRVAALLGLDRTAAQDPRNMELEISEGGQGLSGGQGQLTALSRLFLARPRIWLLDEPSASLDHESEDRVLKALGQWCRPTDILVIATHRPRFAAMATRVLVMGRGRILMDGPPEKCLKPSPGRSKETLDAPAP